MFRLARNARIAEIDSLDVARPLLAARQRRPPLAPARRRQSAGERLAVTTASGRSSNTASTLRPWSAAADTVGVVVDLTRHLGATEIADDGERFVARTAPHLSPWALALQGQEQRRPALTRIVGAASR